MVVLEFKKEKHDETIRLAHQLKEDMCRLVDNIMEAAIVEKHGKHYMHDERRGGSRMGRREDEMDYRGTSYRYPTHPYYPRMNEEFNDRYDY